ncbi:MAG TPA: ABC transporter permease subunit [Actinomycetota bacterium]|jgi:NitT/TauT family transport system permease protein|nr:ABC transporter permease subunit [Actinomycetota bacterium]
MEGKRSQGLDLALGGLGLATLVLLYWVGSRTTTFVPPIGDLLSQIPVFLSEEAIWPDVLATVQRVFGALAMAMVAGFLAAYVMNRGGLWGRVIDRYVNLMLGIPSTIAALLALFIFKRSEVGVYFVVAIITFPFVALTLLQGLRAADRRLDEMSHVYRFGHVAHARHVAGPHLVPYTFAALRNEYAHAWKVVVLAELFAVNTGMGARFARAFDRFLLVDAMLWLLLFMLILLGTEYLLLLPAERRILRWRASAREAAAGEAPA